MGCGGGEVTADERGAGRGGSRTPLGGEAGPALLDWDEQFNTLALNNFYVNWNPAMNKFRRRLHFRLEPEHFFAGRFVDSGAFNQFRKTQLLLSLGPHASKNECKFVFERHRARRPRVLYELRLRLFGFNGTRMRAETECYKEAVVREDRGFDVVADTMIFEGAGDFDNYVLLVEAVPQAFLQTLRPDYGYARAADPLLSEDSAEAFARGKLRLQEELAMSLSLYCWHEAEVVPIPFRELAQTAAFLLPALGRAVVRLHVLAPAEFEFRVDGRFARKYVVGVTAALRVPGPAPFFDSEDFLSRNRVPRAKANVLTVQLDPGEFFLHFFESPAREPLAPEARAVRERFFAEPPRHVRVELFAFNETLSADFASSVARIRAAPEAVETLERVLVKSRVLEQRFFAAELLRDFGLAHARVLAGAWAPGANRGPARRASRALQRFHLNPGFLLSLARDSQLAFEVRPKRPANPRCVFKFCLFALSDAFAPEPLFEPEAFVAQTEFASRVFRLPRNRHGYLALLVPRHLDFAGAFELTVRSDHPLAGAAPSSAGLSTLPWTQAFPGSLGPRAGGPPGSPGLLLGPGFVFSFEPRPQGAPAELFAELSSRDPARRLGLLALRVASPEPLFRQPPEELARAERSGAFQPEFACLHLRLRPGLYMLVPTTAAPLGPADALDFQLRLFSSAQFALESAQAFAPGEVLSRRVRGRPSAEFEVEMRGADTEVLLAVQDAGPAPDALQVVELELGGSPPNPDFARRSHFRKTLNLRPGAAFTRLFGGRASEAFRVRLASARPAGIHCDLTLFSSQRGRVALRDAD